ncbi:magnesium protoporphyrin IX methyltransferase [Limimaricola pyoseonensis]|uniref:Magnesium protoporphyrin IX methyltransferase n=1 Tax=Limimaricola pyoseonensis TaxID=521013 RepID=A0A1G7B0N0_9RHOB|nr:magnesium protoporphyrin IX methyltransferase [Limimaricola pyoseonensis]SDE20407.1 Mg-protoporphyrin IX methyltransferase [Limimaricola pyoseonensis]
MAGTPTYPAGALPLDAPPEAPGYARTRARVHDYFDRSATRTWERLTSDAPVSRIRQTVRSGRDAMRAALLAQMPDDLTGARVLDAGCGAGPFTVELARRGAEVVACDLSPELLKIAAARLPEACAGRVRFVAGDMLDPGLGRFDHVVAMDSLIYYREDDLARALSGLSRRAGQVLFTVAPRTPLLMAMWQLGQLFPRADRAPLMVPHTPARLAAALRFADRPARLRVHDRVNSGFYISQALEVGR